MADRTVWKYELVPDQPIVVYGGDPKVLHVEVDPHGRHNNIPSVWVELTPPDGTTDSEKLELTFIGTGFTVPDGMVHVGSCVTPFGFVWHVYRGV